MTDKKRDPDKSKKLIAAYVKVFSSPEGQIVLQNLMIANNYANSAYERGDPHHTAYQNGMRDCVDRIYKMSKTDPEKLIRAILVEEGSHV